MKKYLLHFKKDKPSYGEISFLKSINISITFISSLILNKSLINNFSMANQYKGSHVIHLFFIFYLLSLPKKNYFVQSFWSDRIDKIIFMLTL